MNACFNDVLLILLYSQQEYAVIVAAIAVVSMGNSYATGSLWGLSQAEISIEEAAAIAITRLETESSNLVEAGMEKEGESLTYEIKFEIGQEEVSVEIDPHTGEILAVERETLEEDYAEDDKEDE